jgi:hypothetical protein
MQNPSLKQRNRAVQKPSSQSATTFGNQGKNDKGRPSFSSTSSPSSSPAWALVLLAVFILGGLFVVEQSTHSSLRDRIHQQQHEKRSKGIDSNDFVKEGNETQDHVLVHEQD